MTRNLRSCIRLPPYVSSITQWISFSLAFVVVADGLGVHAAPPNDGLQHAAEIELLLDSVEEPPGRTFGLLTSRVCADAGGAYQKAQCEANHIAESAAFVSKMFLFRLPPTTIVFEPETSAFTLNIGHMIAAFSADEDDDDEYDFGSRKVFDDEVVFSTRRIPPPPHNQPNPLREIRAVTHWLRELSSPMASFRVRVDETEAPDFESDLEILLFARLRSGPHVRNFRIVPEVGEFSEVLFEPIAIYVSSKSERARSNVARSRWFVDKMSLLKRLTRNRAERLRAAEALEDTQTKNDTTVPETPRDDAGLQDLKQRQGDSAGDANGSITVLELGNVDRAYSAEPILRGWRGRKVRVHLVSGAVIEAAIQSARNLELFLETESVKLRLVDRIELLND